MEMTKVAWNRKSSKVFIRRSSCLVFFLSVLQENHRIERNISLLHKNKVVKKKKRQKVRLELARRKRPGFVWG